MTMLRYQEREKAGPKAGGFRNAQPLAEGLAPLSDAKVREVFSMLFRKKSFDMYSRFKDAQEKLASLYGARVDFAEPPHGGLRLIARLEFLTAHRTIDPDLYDKVAGMGFDLTLRAVPVMEGSPEERYERLERKQPDGSVFPYYEPRSVRTYIVSERNPDISKAVSVAENLLMLAAMLRPAGIEEDLPGKVVDISSARPSAPLLKPQAPEPKASPPAFKEAAAGGSRY